MSARRCRWRATGSLDDERDVRAFVEEGTGGGVAGDWSSR